MSANLELLFLGTGTSSGVPMIGCDCDVCTSADPRDNRDRPGVLIRYDDRQYLIDTTPDLRHQAIRNHITRIDGVVYTHAHADHIFGLDDLRRFNAVMDAPIDIYAEPTAMRTLRHMFPYIFESHKNVNRSFVASLIPHPLDVDAPLELAGVTWTPLRLMHGRLPILGFRIDYPSPAPGPDDAPGDGPGDGERDGERDSAAFTSLAYCTDVSTIPPETYPKLEQLDVLVIDALRYRHHPTHMSVDQALEVIDQLKPKRAFFTHIAHDISHADLSGRLPQGVEIAYDGLLVTV